MNSNKTMQPPFHYPDDEKWLWQYEQTEIQAGASPWTIPIRPGFYENSPRINRTPPLLADDPAWIWWPTLFQSITNPTDADRDETRLLFDYERHLKPHDPTQDRRRW